MLTLPARRCAACGTPRLDPECSCPACGEVGGQDLVLAGRGRLVSWTVIRVAPARYEAEAPYAIGLLELAEGPRVTARLEGDPEQFAAGQEVLLVSVDPARGPIFRPATSEAGPAAGRPARIG
jgi:scaffold protein (connect acetoacetyl-CoA thiolase and HMG-CoA synthase)